jgi:uncharacterized protein YjeT (DUF2065 family)
MHMNADVIHIAGSALTMLGLLILFLFSKKRPDSRLVRWAGPALILVGVALQIWIEHG